LLGRVRVSGLGFQVSEVREMRGDRGGWRGGGQDEGVGGFMGLVE